MTLDEIDNMIGDNLVKYNKVGADKFGAFGKCKQTRLKTKMVFRNALQKHKLELQQKVNEEKNQQEIVKETKEVKEKVEDIKEDVEKKVKDLKKD